jgi:hypothetical protein
MNESIELERYILYEACTYAISELMKNGSNEIAIFIKGKWRIRKWELILEELNDIFGEVKNV